MGDLAIYGAEKGSMLPITNIENLESGCTEGSLGEEYLIPLA